MQRLLRNGNKNGIGTTTRVRKISKGSSGSMQGGFTIIAIGGEEDGE